MSTQYGSGGVCGFLRQYKTQRQANNTFFEPWTNGNPLPLTTGPGFLNYFRVVIDTVPADGLFFELQERGSTQTDAGQFTLATQYQQMAISPIIVPVVDGAGNPISGIEWEFSPPEEEWLNVDGVLVRLGQGYDKGLCIQVFNADGTNPGELGSWNLNCRFVHTRDISACRDQKGRR